MKTHKMKIHALVLLALASGIEATQGQEKTSLILDRISCIGFVTHDANWKKQNWEQLKGKKMLLLTFFPRCFTGNCSSQLTSLRDAYPELQKAGVEVWAISTDEADGPKGQRAFGKSLNIPFPLIPDPKRKLSLRPEVIPSRLVFPVVIPPRGISGDCRFIISVKSRR